jgi:biopolymer transport protein ExbB/TolQ
MNSNVMMQKLVLVAPLVARVVLYVLIGLSVLSIGVILERWWFFRRRRDDIGKLSEAVRMGLSRGDWSAVKKALASSRSLEAEIVGEAVGWHPEGPEAVEQIMAKALRLRRKTFEAGLLFLGTLGNNAPFIGLFGTVLGIVTAFRELGGNQMGAAMGNVMGGIAEALLATAVGILVAIPAVVFYNVFQKKGADIEEGAAAIGNVVLASMRAHPKSNGVVVAVESTGRPVGVGA